MKKTIIICLSAIALWGCKSNEPKIIPTDKLEQITVDIYLSNAYMSLKGLNADSLEIYQPIFEKYGYNATDMLYTINNLSKRKSIRFSDILEQAQARLEAEHNRYAAQVALLDTVDRRIELMFQKEIYSDTAITVKDEAGLKKLRIEFPAEQGTYEVRYNYMVDSSDNNYGIEARLTLLYGGDSTVMPQRQYLGRRVRKPILLRAEVKDTMVRKVRIDLARYRDQLFSTPDIRIDSVSIIRYLPKAVAQDSVLRIMLPFNPVITTGHGKRVPKDYVALPADSAGTAARHGADPRR